MNRHRPRGLCVEYVLSSYEGCMFRKWPECDRSQCGICLQTLLLAFFFCSNSASLHSSRSLFCLPFTVHGTAFRRALKTAISLALSLSVHTLPSRVLFRPQVCCTRLLPRFFRLFFFFCTCLKTSCLLRLSPEDLSRLLYTVFR